MRIRPRTGGAVSCLVLVRVYRALKHRRRPSGRAVSAEERRRAEQMWAVLMPVSEKLGVFAQLPIAEMRELIDQVQDVLDGVWSIFTTSWEAAAGAAFPSKVAGVTKALDSVDRLAAEDLLQARLHMHAFARS